MTILTRFDTFTAYVKNALFLIGVLVAATGAIGSLGSLVAVKMLWPMLLSELKTELNIATRDDLARIEHDLRELSGENRVAKTLPGTYILEPVTEGDPIDMVLSMRRTERGVPCVLLDAMPLFSDQRDIPFPGEMLKIVKQVGISAERLPLTLQVPDMVEPGRVSVAISMHYSCPFGKESEMIDVFEETEDFPFQMLSRDLPVK